MKRLLISLIFILSVFAIPLSAYACSMGQGQMMDMGESPWFQYGVTLTLKNAENLGLDDKQINRLEGIRDKYTKEIIKLEADLKALEIDLNTLLKTDNIDLPKIKNTVKKIEGAQSQTRYLRIEAFTEARKVLKPEQKEKLKKLIEMPPAQMKGYMGKDMDCPMMKGGMGGSMMGGGKEGGMMMDCPMMKGGMGGMMGGMMGGNMGGETTGGQTKNEEVAAAPQTQAGTQIQEKTAGAVTIIAAIKNPVDIGGSSELVFDLKLDTHSVNLDAFNFNEGIVLKDDKGNIYKPVSTKPSGSGHHRESEVRFKNPRAAGFIELVVKDIGGVKETVFRWESPKGIKM